MEVNKVYNEDCILGLSKLPDESVDLIITDPPYRVTPRGSNGTMSGYWINVKSKRGTIFDYNNIDIEDYLPHLYRVLKNGTHCYIMCNNLNLPHFLHIIEMSEFKFVKCLIWDKCRKITGKFYMGQYEYIIMLRKGKERIINDCGTSDIISIPNNKTKKNGTNLHDSEKPVKLMEILINNSSNEGNLVLDPFMGSGSTAIAALNCNRNYIGYEIDPKYFSVITDRLSEYNSAISSNLF